MTEREKRIITNRRERGDSIAAIAKDLGLKPNSVKSFCQRQNIDVPRDDVCLKCGSSLPDYENGRPRRFCSDKCRQEYWNTYPRNYRTDHTCPACGQAFKARKSRKYCSHPCYIKDRSGGGK